MPLIQWNSSFLIGITEIDRHHHHLIQLLNEIYDEHRSGTPSRSQQEIIVELADYAKYHFSYEEELMEEFAYSGATQHKEEHMIFSDRVIEFQKQFKLGVDVSIEVISFVSNWIAFHILKADTKLGDFVGRAKVAQTAVRKFD
jgi:hemerythrin